MMRVRLLGSLLALAAAAGPLAAQQMGGMQGMQHSPPPKKSSFQVTGAMTIPVFSYADFTDDIGWNAQAVIAIRRGPYNHIRLEGEYNSVGLQNAGTLTGGAEVY